MEKDEKEKCRRLECRENAGGSGQTELDSFQWLYIATRGIRFKPDRAAVCRELEAHLEDKRADLQRIFPDLSPEEAEAIRTAWPEAAPWIRRFCGSVEFIEGQERYCLWLKGVEPEAYAHMPEIRQRVEAVARFRRVSPREATRALAERPALFGEIRQPETGRYILVPRVSSERRPYIPMGFLPA